MGPLEGIRVLDLTRVLSGPYCTMFLGDFGADVIKIEEPGAGDETRTWGPPFAGGESAYFLCANRNKRSVAINLKCDAGIALLRRLAGAADVLVENFRPGTMERLGLSEPELRAGNPQLIYASCSSFGADGPMKDWPAVDLILQAWGGLMSVTGSCDGEPTKVGVALVDVLAGLMLGSGILAALFARQRGGAGQRVETSLLEANVASLVNVASNYLVGGSTPGRWGNAHANIVPYQSFQTRDGFLVLGVTNERIWRRFCDAASLPELAYDARFAGNSDRVRNRDVLVPMLSERFQQRETAAWVKLLMDAGVPCSPVQSIDQVFESPQVRHRQMLAEVPHPTAGTVRMAGLPVKISATPASIRLPPPLLGEHTDAVLRDWLQIGDREHAELRAQGAI